MSEVLSSSFDVLPYRHGAIAETHPARVGAIARMLGRNAAPPDRCRVLELGCAAGMNLLPLAERLPGSDFLGVDFSQEHIALAEEARRAAPLTNIRFLQADVREFEPEAGAFDYVIAHGVYSWVSAEVRECLLALCAQALAPEGVAYVSYNVYPAWGLIGGLRAVLRAELAAVPDPAAHLARLLPALERAFASPSDPYAVLMREIIGEMAGKSPDLLLHDELEAVNDPVTFLEFRAHAERHGLHYLAEAHFASMPLEHLPPSAREALGELQLDFARGQQFLDLLGNRRFRNSLLVRGAPPLTRELEAAAVTQCAIGLHVAPADGRLDLASGVPVRFTGRHGFEMTVSEVAPKAFFAALCEGAPARVPFAQALWRAADLTRLTGARVMPDEASLATAVAKLFAMDQCDLLLPGDAAWLKCSPNPAPTPLMRHQARAGWPVTNRWHENVELTADERRWVAGEGPAANADALIRTGLGV